MEPVLKGRDQNPKRIRIEIIDGDFVKVFTLQCKQWSYEISMCDNGEDDICFNLWEAMMLDKFTMTADERVKQSLTGGVKDPKVVTYWSLRDEKLKLEKEKEKGDIDVRQD